MATYSDLVDVKFVDNTTYANTTDGDVVGAYLNWYWGPSGEVVSCQQRDFFHYFPASRPATFTDTITAASGSTSTTYSLDFSDTDSYIQLKRFFEAGGSTAEVYRSSKLEYASVSIKDGTVGKSMTPSESNRIYAKYRGIPSQEMLGDYSCVGVVLSKEDEGLTIRVIAWNDRASATAAPTDYTILEEFKYVSLIPGTILDGKSVYINDVLRNSDWLQGSTSDSYDDDLVDAPKVEFLFKDLYLNGTLTIDELSVNQISEVVGAFEDIETTTATWFLGKEFTTIAASRKTSIAIQSYPATSTLSKDLVIKDYANAAKSQFAVYLAGREVVPFWGKQVPSSCAGAWCGLQCATASQVRINQVASAKTYGAYSGILQSSLSFNDVLTLHDLGINSIYSTITGPYMFGVHTTFSRQTSYYGKLNVMRVVTRLLRDVLPSFLGAIHTDTASNPITRRSFGIAVQSIVDEYISNQNLKPQSLVDVSENVNNDYTTKSGTILNAVFELWFIGLVEKVKITIQATDSTVSADIE